MSVPKDFSIFTGILYFYLPSRGQVCIFVMVLWYFFQDMFHALWWVRLYLNFMYFLVFHVELPYCLECMCVFCRTYTLCGTHVWNMCYVEHTTEMVLPLTKKLFFMIVILTTFSPLGTQCTCHLHVLGCAIAEWEGCQVGCVQVTGLYNSK